MRAIDIANLKLSDIKWEEQTIHFIQSKTKNAVSLPINSEAISALADYILNGRPASEEMNIFLSLKAPYNRVGQYGCLSSIVAKHIRELEFARSSETENPSMPFAGAWVHGF